MNSAWVKKMTARFHALDLNKDGVLTKADFDIFTERTIQIGKLSEAQAERNWKLHNEIVSVFGGENLKLTLADFIQAQAKYSTGDYPSMVANKFFDVIDTDGDGIISYTEWTVYFECIGVDVKHARPCFDALDTNKDGKLSRSEFVDATINFHRCTDESHPSRFIAAVSKIDSGVRCRILSESAKDNMIQVPDRRNTIDPCACDKGPIFQNEACCSRTLKRHVSEVWDVRTLLSPERPDTVLEEKIRVLESEEKNKIQTEARISLNIDATTGLAMKATLGMPSNELRTLRMQFSIQGRSGDLAASQRKGYNIRVFMSGDYEFLCALYETSGTSDVTDMELTTASYDAYVAAVKDLTTYKEQLEAICLEQTSVKDLFNYSAMIVGESGPLLSSLVEENERCSKKIAELEQMIADVNQKLEKGLAVF
eukprot:Em0024g192a